MNIQVTTLPINEIFYGDIESEELSKFLEKAKEWLTQNGWEPIDDFSPNSDCHKEIYGIGQISQIGWTEGLKPRFFNKETGEDIFETEIDFPKSPV